MNPGDLVTTHPDVHQFDLYDLVGYWIGTVQVKRGEPRPTMLYIGPSLCTSLRSQGVCRVLFEDRIVQIHTVYLEVVS